MSRHSSPDLNKPLLPTPEEVSTLNLLTSAIHDLHAEIAQIEEAHERTRDFAGW